MLRSRVPQPLTPSEISRMEEIFSMEVKQIKNLFERFCTCYPYGYLTRADFEEHLTRTLYREHDRRITLDKFMIGNFFQRFDVDRDKKLNFQEFVTLVLLTNSGTNDEKLNCILRMIDRNQEKYYDKRKILNFFKDFVLLFNLTEIEDELQRFLLQVLDHHHRSSSTRGKMNWSSVCRSLQGALPVSNTSTSNENTISEF